MCRYILSILFSGLVTASFAYTNAFTLDFNAAGGESNWTEATAGSVIIGETTPPAGSPFTPQSATGNNGNGWLRIVTPQAAGVGVAYYNGQAGGSTADVTQFTIEADVFIVADPAVTTRYQVGLVGSWDSADLYTPVQLFYSHNTPSQANGYGMRGTNDGVANAYNSLGAPETTNKWVRMKFVISGTSATGSVDTNKDGTYDISKTVTFDGAAGKPGLVAVVNDGTSSGGLVPNQYGYFDNFKYTPSTTVQDWNLY